MKIKIELDLKSVMSDLKEVGEKVERKGKRTALTKASRLIISDLRGRVKDESGNLRKSISSKIVVKKGRSAKAVIGASNQTSKREGSKQVAGSRYLHLSEGKDSADKVAAKMDASLSATEARVEAVMIEELKKAVEGAK